MMKSFTRLLALLLIMPALSYPSPDSLSGSINSRTETSFTSSNLPIIVINTHGQIIPNDYKITADMGIIFNGEGVRNYVTDPLNNYNGKIGIELRGSSSQMFPKKQYAVETRDTLGEDLKVSLLGFPSESDWILFAPYNDKTLMRDALAYRLARDMGRYASRSKFCEMVLNGEYMGVYVLFEKVKRDANRVNIKKMEPGDISGDALTGGYIIKIDKLDGETNDGWYSDYLPFPQSSLKIFYQYHYPKPEDIVTPQKNYIQNLIFNFETTMKYSQNLSDSLTGYPRYIDDASFVDFILVNELTKNIDSYRLSTYLYKDRDSRNPKLYAGPVWDYNLAFGNANYYEAWLTNGWYMLHVTDFQNIGPDEYFLTPFWWRRLFDHPPFRNKTYARWQQLKVNVFSPARINGIVDSLANLLDEAKTRNFIKWPVLGEWVWPNYFVGQSYIEEIQWIKNWIISRYNWMDANMIGEPTSVPEETDSPKDLTLLQNHPNPFSDKTKIRYKIPTPSLYRKGEGGAAMSLSKWEGLGGSAQVSGTIGTTGDIMVTLKIYDLLGRELATLVNETKSPGVYETELNTRQFSGGGKLASGVYFCRLNAGGNVKTIKMVVID
ncbi:MAG: CotH kinase family protein [Ignavibacteriaceae bacterium]|nr:CotH kinase family protein [Ignavibacteriaceae bacterium]